MEFKKYQHLERFGTTEVLNIELGTVYVFPKIDGTNASVWLGDDGATVCAGSRTRQLSLEKDNAGFFAWVQEQDNIREFLENNPDLRLYGEWLVPHSLKTYRNDAWRDFYVFDVVDVNGDYLSYDMYKPILEKFNINYIPPIKIITNGSYEDFVFQMNSNNNYLIQDGKGMGEGVVLKNYSFVNKYGRTTWAKIVSSEFKEKHTKEMGAPEVGYRIVEQDIVDEFVTQAFCEKELAKIEDFTSKQIPRLLNTIFYELVREESWNFIKKHKNPTIDFKKLQHLTFCKVKINLPQIFGV